MKNLILIFFLITFGIQHAQAQKKKELLDEIEMLRNQLKNKELELVNSNNKVKTTLKKLDETKLLIEEAEEENQNLLKTISGFASVSKQKADNLTQSLETIKKKDAQLKVINDALAKAEEEKLKRLTLFREGLGTMGKVGFQNGLLVIEISNHDLYGEEDKVIQLTENGKKIIKKLGDILTQYPEYDILIEGNSNAVEFEKENLFLKDNWDLSALQVVAIARVLQLESSVLPKRIQAIARSEYHTADSVETITRILVKSNFKAFFELVRENMKN